jgi:5'-3' exonuclease
MGVAHLFELAPHDNVRDDDLRNCAIAVDMSIVAHGALAAFGRNMLTTAEGRATGHLNVLATLLGRAHRNGLRLVFCADPARPPALKAETLARRRARDGDHPSWARNAQAWADFETALTIAQVPTCRAPDGYDAEHLAAQLARDNVVDYVLSEDSDVLVYGYPEVRLLRRGHGGFKRYGAAALGASMTRAFGQPVTRESLARIAVGLGCDFAPKIRGVGPRHANAALTIPLTDVQIAAVGHFLAPCPYDRPACTPQRPTGYLALVDWLVGTCEFKRERVEKLFR